MLFRVVVALAMITFLLAACDAASGGGGSTVSCLIDAVPQGYYLYAYDDCGEQGRQPHVRMDDSYMWTFQPSDTDAELRERSAVFSYKQVNAVYDDLDPRLDYVLAMTYASDHVYKRVQSLEADGVGLHGPYALPNARAVRVIVKVPKSVTEDGKMALAIKIHGEVNATASIIELWATAPPPVTLRMEPIWGMPSKMCGRVVNLMHDPLPGAEIVLSRPGMTDVLSKTATDADGVFQFDRKMMEGLGMDELQVTARHEGREIGQTIVTKGLFFDPVRYRPIPTKTQGLRSNQIRLDGLWRISPDGSARGKALDDPAWSRFKVPGQWLQQGYDVPQDKPVYVAREFTVPKEWSGRRIFVRFDSIHAGTDYSLNGKHLGYSENLYTPVEWEITDCVRFGEPNLLDLAMTVQTKSEQLSFSSGYAFHNLGGIDRSVRVYVLPNVNIRELHISTDLDKNYRNAELNLKLTLDNSQHEAAEGLSLHVSVVGPDGPVGQVRPITSLPSGSTPVDMTIQVPSPLKWTAETPHLYKMVLEMKSGPEVIERIERNIGFRKIEIRGSQLYVNGKRVKLAGACHHEMDPLTGRADAMRHAEQDVKLMKSANLNYVRTSHYPPCQELLDAADRIGMYVEVEAPFCWVGPTDDMSCVKQILTPTSAMVDYCHTHPSVLVWSIANESHFNEFFGESNSMVNALDPTRPTTFNHAFSKEAESRVCGIANLHYPGMPYDDLLPDDKRPLFLGEYFFPICHEQTDVAINPGLRELWGAGHAEPDTAYGKACAAELAKPPLKPGLVPGGWSYMYRSDRVIGGAIWASHDDGFYFPDGKTAGYAWHHGFWGLIDVWRRPKPEWWLSKLIFSPVWFPVRQVDFRPGQRSITVPVENRYSFTDLKTLKFEWTVAARKGVVNCSQPPASTGKLSIPIPAGAKSGDKVLLRVTDASGELINALAIHLGAEKRKPLPVSTGCPTWTDDGKTITVTGRKFGLVLDRANGDFDATNPKHTSAITKFPSVHVTRYDFGDLNGPKSPPYAVFPDAATRTVENVSVSERKDGLEITVRDRYDGFAGWMKWLIGANGVGVVTYDYEYSGEDIDTREQGIRFMLRSVCDEVKWCRWSEWDVYPDDFIGRTEGVAKAHRDPRLGKAAWNRKPSWPWSLDETEQGTADFRAIKFNIYEASVVSPNGSGLKVHANADAHLRPCLMPNGVSVNILNECRLGQIPLKKGEHLKGRFVIEILSVAIVSGG